MASKKFTHFILGLGIFCYTANLSQGATTWLLMEGVVEKVLRMDGMGQISEDNSAVFSVGTRWSLSGSLGDRSQSTHTYGIDLLGSLSFGESLYLTFEAAQIEYDNGDSNSRSWWSVSVENETPDNPSEARTLIPNTSFNELSLSVGPWWSADHTPPFGTTLIPSGGSSFSLSLSTLDGGLFLQGYVDRMVVAVPEPTAAFLAGVSGLWLISRRRIKAVAGGLSS